MKRIMQLCIFLLFIMLYVPVLAGTDDYQYEMIIHASTLDDAVRQACIPYQCGFGFWDEAIMETVGCAILDYTQKDSIITVYAYTAHSVFKFSDGIPENIAGSLAPARIVLSLLGDNEYQLMSYHVPEDGSNHGQNIRRLFPQPLADKLLSPVCDEYKKAAMNDAYATAHSYALDNNTAANCVTFLQTGSNSLAQRIVQESILGWIPTSVGTFVWQQYGREYSLSVDGEQSYSGILHYTITDHLRNTHEAFSVKVDGSTLQILSGKLPDPF